VRLVPVLAADISSISKRDRVVHVVDRAAEETVEADTQAKHVVAGEFVHFVNQRCKLIHWNSHCDVQCCQKGRNSSARVVLQFTARDRSAEYVIRGSLDCAQSSVLQQMTYVF
jgi:hypothetical protein